MTKFVWDHDTLIPNKQFGKFPATNLMQKNIWNRDVMSVTSSCALFVKSALPGTTILTRTINNDNTLRKKRRRINNNNYKLVRRARSGKHINQPSIKSSNNAESRDTHTHNKKETTRRSRRCQLIERVTVSTGVGDWTRWTRTALQRVPAHARVVLQSQSSKGSQ